MKDENSQAQSVGISNSPAQNDRILQSQRAAVDLRRQKIEEIYAGRTNFSTPQTTPIRRSQGVNYTSQQPQMASVGGDQNTQITPQSQPNSNAISRDLKNSQGSQRVIQPISVAQKQPQNVSKVGAVDYLPKQEVRNLHAPQKEMSSNDQWKRYHAAWQNYYQKYYENYYNAAIDHHKKVANIQPEVIEELSEEEKRARALAQLKQDISKKARERTAKIRKSRHLVPIFSAVFVVAMFLFLQYNRLIFASVEAYVSPGNSSAQNTIQAPNSSTAAEGEKLIIPKINVDVPINYGFGNDHASQMKAMETGVSHFAISGANSVPGQAGNVVLSGHSSNDLFDNGEYKFIFAQLEKMTEGDTIYVNHEGVRYSYVVRSKEVVLPTEVSKVIRNDGKSWLTLITCTPLGTAQKRLLVFAEQVSPSPASNKQSSSVDNSTSETVELPRNSKTFFEKLFSWDWS